MVTLSKWSRQYKVVALPWFLRLQVGQIIKGGHIYKVGDCINKVVVLSAGVIKTVVT